jgi:hypothetical protein
MTTDFIGKGGKSRDSNCNDRFILEGVEFRMTVAGFDVETLQLERTPLPTLAIEA